MWCHHPHGANSRVEFVVDLELEWCRKGGPACRALAIALVHPNHTLGADVGCTNTPRGNTVTRGESGVVKCVFADVARERRFFDECIVLGVECEDTAVGKDRVKAVGHVGVVEVMPLVRIFVHATQQTLERNTDL